MGFGLIVIFWEEGMCWLVCLKCRDGSSKSFGKPSFQTHSQLHQNHPYVWPRKQQQQQSKVRHLTKFCCPAWRAILLTSKISVFADTRSTTPAFVRTRKQSKKRGKWTP